MSHLMTESIILGAAAWSLVLPALWMWQTIITNFAYPIRVFSCAEPTKKSIPASCGVQMWLPEE